MNRVVIFGNSGSGKSTLAMQLCKAKGLAYLDLDSIAWQAVSPPERKPINQSKLEIDAFIGCNENWVIEGCYSDLLETAIAESSEIIFLNLPVEACISNAKSRPWEPHKYKSKEAQDANLDMLIEWIAQYPEREDTFSKASHEAMFNGYSGKKTMVAENDRQQYNF